MAAPWKVLDLDPDEPLKRAVPKLARARLQETFSYQSQLLKTYDAEAVHDMRVSARRLQTVLRTFHEVLPRKRVKPYERRVEELVRLLGDVRELDVALAILTLPMSASQTRLSGVAILAARLEYHRNVARKHLTRFLTRMDRERFTDRFSDVFGRER